MTITITGEHVLFVLGLALVSLIIWGLFEVRGRVTELQRKVRDLDWGQERQFDRITAINTDRWDLLRRVKALEGGPPDKE